MHIFQIITIKNKNKNSVICFPKYSWLKVKVAYGNTTIFFLAKKKKVVRGVQSNKNQEMMNVVHDPLKR